MKIETDLTPAVHTSEPDICTELIIDNQAIASCASNTSDDDAPKVSYSLPKERVHLDWSGCKQRGFTPTERQRLVMDAVAQALSQGLYYNVDVHNSVVKRLRIDKATLELNTINTERGNVGMDIYYARCALESADLFSKQDKAMNAWMPAVGDKIGSLSVGYKRTTNCVITAINGSTINCTGKRGSVSVTFAADVLLLGESSRRAVTKEWRKTPLFTE